MRALYNSTPVNDSVMRDDQLTEQIIESAMAVYVMPVIIVIGTLGNLTSLAVLLRRRMRRTSVYLYLTALALADVSVLYISAFKTWIRLVRPSTCVHALSRLSVSFSFTPEYAIAMSTTACYYAALPLRGNHITNCPLSVCLSRPDADARCQFSEFAFRLKCYIISATFCILALHLQPERKRYNRRYVNLPTLSFYWQYCTCKKPCTYEKF